MKSPPMGLAGVGLRIGRPVDRLTCEVVVEEICPIQFRTRHGGGAGPLVAGEAATVAGSATVTPGGTCPIRVAKTGVVSTCPCAPHSLPITVSVSEPRSVPSACNFTDNTAITVDGVLCPSHLSQVRSGVSCH